MYIHENNLCLAIEAQIFKAFITWLTDSIPMSLYKLNITYMLSYVNGNKDPRWSERIFWKFVSSIIINFYKKTKVKYDWFSEKILQCPLFQYQTKQGLRHMFSNEV